MKINAEFLRQIAPMHKIRLLAHAERLTFIMRKKCWDILLVSSLIQNE